MFSPIELTEDQKRATAVQIQGLKLEPEILEAEVEKQHRRSAMREHIQEHVREQFKKASPLIQRSAALEHLSRTPICKGVLWIHMYRCFFMKKDGKELIICGGGKACSDR